MVCYPAGIKSDEIQALDQLFKEGNFRVVLKNGYHEVAYIGDEKSTPLMAYYENNFVMYHNAINHLPSTIQTEIYSLLKTIKHLEDIVQRSLNYENNCKLWLPNTHSN